MACGSCACLLQAEDSSLYKSDSLYVLNTLQSPITFAPLTMMILPFGSSTASFMLRPYGIASTCLQQQQTSSSSSYGYVK
jgi:hypothetical protein